MNFQHGLISADSHGQLEKDAFVKRMSRIKWGDSIPHIAEVTDQSSGKRMDRWFVNGRPVRAFGACNCPAVMPPSKHKIYPQHWEEVPPKVYQPLERLKALDEDGVDAEVLFPNDPGGGRFFQFAEDPAFELACVQAYNDALAEWRQASSRYIPLALLPYLSDIDVIVRELERAVKQGHRGVVMLADPGMLIQGRKHLHDRWWDPLWAACQDLEVPVHVHESGGLAHEITYPRWAGYTEAQFHSALTIPTGAFPSQFFPYLLFSGMLERYPGLNWVSAETGIGWVNYVLEGSDHEWERRRLWTEGITTRPSDLFKQHVYVNFWFEKSGIEQRYSIGVDNIMWESDYPHTASTYPKSWSYIEDTMKTVPEQERKKILYQNAAHLYHLDAS
ncbi:MAG TPA: amidohydrolase family protein [Candidatus Binatia bacterium]|jgi:predicted TIM-barrel fold metal-dependent hydrolase